MEYLRKRADGEVLRGGYMCSNDHVKNWHMTVKIRDSVHKGDASRLDKEFFSSEIPKLDLRTKNKEERLKSSKSQKQRERDNVNSNLKTNLKPQTAREANKPRQEVKRFRKSSDRIKKQLAVTCWKNVRKMEMVERVETSTSSVRKESFEERMVEVIDVKNSPRKGKKKNEEKGNKSTGQAEKESGKELERKVLGRKQKTKKSGEDEYYRLPLTEFSDDRGNGLNETPGKAVVIYQRENRQKCLNPQTGDGAQYEQISFTGSRDLNQSEKSFFEPRHNSLSSLKDLYVSRRRTRFHVEPIKPSPTPSDFQSTVSLLKEYRASSEYQKFCDYVGNTKRSYKTSTEDGEGCKVFREASSSQKTPTDKEEVAARLKETAKKKLNLHREMIRAEKKNKKKFWESIQKSLNYRCALAEMFSSSQSFLSNKKYSSPVSTSTEQSTRQEILVQECVIKSVSSYQSFEGFEKPKTKHRKEVKVKTHSSPTSPLETYRDIPKNSQPRVVSEDELEEKIIANHDLENVCLELTSQSSVIPTDNMFNLSTSSLRGTTSGKCNLLDSSLTGDTNQSSELESLMAKLSQEIRRCSHFIKELNSSEHSDPEDKQMDSLSNQISVSDSELEVIKDCESRREMLSEKEKGGEGLNTVMVYRVAECAKEESEVKRVKMGGKKCVDAIAEVKHSRKKDVKGKKREKGIVKAELILKRVASNGSYYSSCVGSSTSSSIISRKVVRSANREVICCDYCKFLQKRIFKLEKDLERIEKILPLYPVEYQDSLKDCLERLKTASDCVLKRLKSCAKLRHGEHQKETSKVMGTGDLKRPKSAPTTNDQSQRGGKLFLKSSTSENEVSLGTELSEEKAVQSDVPKVNDRIEVLKKPQPPLVMEANYLCPPTTGTIVKTFSDSSSSAPSIDEMKELNSNSRQTPTQTVVVEKGGSINPPKKESTSQEQSFQEESKYVKQPEDSQSSRNGVETIKKEELAPNKVKEPEVTSLFPGNGECAVIEKGKEEMGQSKTSEKKERPKWSRIPTRRKATPNNLLQKADSVSVNSSWGTLSRSDANSVHTQHGSEISLGSIQNMLAKLFSFTWTFGFFLCKLVHYMQSVSAICSVLTLTAMSLERYYAVVHPMKAQYICTISQARRIITGTWISAFLLAVPILFAQVHLRVGVKVEAYWCVRDWDNKAIWRAHELYMMLLILVVPTGVMAVAYTAICWEIWEVMQRRQDMTAGKGHEVCRKPRLTKSWSSETFPAAAYTNNNTRLNGRKRGRGLLKREDDGASVKQVIKMLVAVVIIYVLCWGPMLIDNVLQAYGILNHIRIGWLKYMGTAFHLMAYFNSCINPIIYGFMSKNFRESFMKALCCGRRKPKTGLRSFSLSQTRNTSIRYAESSFGRTVSIALPV